MADKYLHRDDAPFTREVWELIDKTVRAAAVSQLSARKLLHAQGPFGYGLKSIPGPEQVVEGKEGEAQVRASISTPVASVIQPFSLAAGDIEQHEQSGLPIDMKAVVSAALACARKEDELLFYGSKALGIPGLLNTSGIQSMGLRPWAEVGDAVEDIIAATSLLDEAGFHGPYSLALTPGLYNKLFRRYPQGNTIELDHLKSLVTDGIVKAPSIREGGVLLATGKQFASIVLGQDMMTGFEGPEGRDYNFFISESLALKVSVPSTVCLLNS